MDPIEPLEPVDHCAAVAPIEASAITTFAPPAPVDTGFEPAPCYLDLTCASIAAAAAAQDLRLFVRGPRPARRD